MGAVAAWGVGLATHVAPGDDFLCAWFPRVGLDGPDAEALARAVPGSGPRTVVLTDVPAALVGTDAGAAAATLLGADRAALRDGMRRSVVVTLVEDLAAGPVDGHDAYLRLQLLSHRAVAPRGLSLDGVFGLLPIVVWSDRGPFPAKDFEARRLALATEGVHVGVRGVDRFPRMTDFVVPDGVRIADAARVRLGAHLSPGTTVMHEGFVNFNAGTLGASMVEGRISAGVVVGDGTDLGGGASIMGTLSGGGTEVISIGEHCLIGANAGVGISLGDHCVVEAGLYVTAGTKVTLPDGSVVAARALSGRDGMLLRRDSVTGRVEALERRPGSWGGLNPALHAPS